MNPMVKYKKSKSKIFNVNKYLIRRNNKIKYDMNNVKYLSYDSNVKFLEVKEYRYNKII